MSLRNLSINLTIIIILFSTLTMLQADEGKSVKKSKLGGVIYFNWHQNMTDEADNEAADKKNTFEIERIYLTWKITYNDMFSSRVTTDVGKETMIEKPKYTELDTDGDGTADEELVNDSSSENQKYRLYIKYAYGQFKYKTDPVNVKFKFGMLGTPSIGFIDKLGDQRWILQNFIDSSKKILIKPDGKGYSIDNSADLGTSLKISAMKLVELEASYTVGEGYKKSDESQHSPTDDGKAYAGRLTISPPVPDFPIFISVFGRLEGTDTDEVKNHKGYYGFGLALKHKIVKIGANYILPFEKVDDENLAYVDGSGNVEEYDMSLIDVWLTVELNNIIGMPLFIMGRYGLGDTGLNNGKTQYIGSGLGYRFEKHVRLIAWYQMIDNEARDEAKEANPEQALYIKAEIKL